MDMIDAVSGAMIEMRDTTGKATYKRVEQDNDELKVASSRRRQILV
jgi:hypothetical protein